MSTGATGASNAGTTSIYDRLPELSLHELASQYAGLEVTWDRTTSDYSPNAGRILVEVARRGVEHFAFLAIVDEKLGA
jgi:hypothetical protein